MLPYRHAPVLHTPSGIPYLTEPGVVVVHSSTADYDGLQYFLEEWDPDFADYLDDEPLAPLEQIVKVSGQLCYASFGPKRTRNRDAGAYFSRIIDQRHVSLFYQPTVGVFIYGISRAAANEWIRHHVGAGVSQLSQRFVDSSLVRFVLRPELVGYPGQDEYYQRVLAEYQQRREWLRDRVPNTLTGVEARKWINQSARDALPNETETVLAFSGNIQTWRNILVQRGSSHADTAIRAVAVRCYECLAELAPQLFQDFICDLLPDGTLAVRKQ